MENIHKLAEYLAQFAQRKQRESLYSSNITPKEPSQVREPLRLL